MTTILEHVLILLADEKTAGRRRSSLWTDAVGMKSYRDGDDVIHELGGTRLNNDAYHHLDGLTVWVSAPWGLEIDVEGGDGSDASKLIASWIESCVRTYIYKHVLDYYDRHICIFHPSYSSILIRTKDAKAIE